MKKLFSPWLNTGKIKQKNTFDLSISDKNPQNVQIQGQINQFFDKCFRENGANEHGVGWHDATGQRMRYYILYNILNYIDQDSISITDFGCGYGAGLWELVNIINNNPKYNNLKIYYTGIDANVDMVNRAYASTIDLSDMPNLEISFLHQEYISERTDAVISSGIFGYRGDLAYQKFSQHAYDMIDHMFDFANSGIAFNMLSKQYKDTTGSKYYYADPCEFYKYCVQNLSRYTQLRHDYLIHDFTLIVPKKPLIYK